MQTDDTALKDSRSGFLLCHVSGAPQRRESFKQLDEGGASPAEFQPWWGLELGGKRVG